MKVLYIEDNPVDIDLTVRQLKKDSPSVHIDTANSQTEALQIIKSEYFPEYDLVLTDMHLPDGDGIAILSHIRGHSLPVAVVLLTGQGDEEAAVAALKAGADDYIVKKQGYLSNLFSLLENALTSFHNSRSHALQILKVLYVEHNQADVDLTRRHLDKYAPHIQLEPVHRVSDFYALLEQKETLASCSALLVDYRLPQDNALEILKKVKSSRHFSLPVILITGKGDEEIAVKALKLGAFDYLTKNQGYLYKLPSIIENAYYSMELAREHQALIESEKRYRVLFEDSHIVKLLIEPESGQVVDVNAAATRFYGWSRDEFRTKNMSEINPLPPEKLQEARTTVLETKSEKFTFQHRLADGSIRDVEVYTGPIEIGGKKLIYSTIHDITDRLAGEREREKLQKSLLQAQKMEAFGQLAGGIAHDFNNILTSILGYSELALNMVDKDSRLEEDLQEIHTAGIRAKELVGQILAFARQSDEAVEPVSPHSIAKEVLKLIRSSTSASIDIRQHLNSHAIVRGNAIKIHQILMNLCSNGIQAMEDTGTLEICLQDVEINGGKAQATPQLLPGKYVQMSVSDTGSGIPHDILDHIFEPYFTTKPLGEGTGLGLSMVHGIVKSYGGTITVQSEPDKGTVFTIYLPVAEKRVDTLPKPKALPKGNERILLVDDEVPIAKVQEQILHRLGYTVTAMTDSTAAFELFCQNPHAFDLVITDTNMPKLMGDKLTTEILNIRPDMPVILCTGFSKNLTEKSAREIGAKSLLNKPIIAQDFAKTIRQVLDDAKKDKA